MSFLISSSSPDEGKKFDMTFWETHSKNHTSIQQSTIQMIELLKPIFETQNAVGYLMYNELNNTLENTKIAAALIA